MENPFDDTAKSRYRRFFEQRGMRAITQYEVFSLSRSTDLVVECSLEDRAVLQKTVFAHFRHINAVEFKGYHDPLTVSDLNLIMMRAWGIGVIDQSKAKSLIEQPQSFTNGQLVAEQPDQRTVTVICVTRPRKILDTLQAAFGFHATGERGIYCDHAQKVPAWIIHPTELTLQPSNYALLPLARGEKLEQFIELCLAQGLVEYLQLTLDIGLVTDPDVIWRKILEVYDMALKIHEETWPYIDEFFRTVPEAMQKVPTFQEALEASERQGILQTQRRTLIRFLHHKFGELPDYVLQMIEETIDSTKLDQWMDQVFDATTLADMAF